MAQYWLATDGNDANPGTREEPFRTWKYAISKLTQNGDELVVKPGLYSQGVPGAMMPAREQYAGWVTIRAEVPGTVKVWYGSQYVLLPVRPYTRVQGIWFSGGTGIRWADRLEPKHHVLIEDCEFKSAEESIAATGRRCGRPLDLCGGSYITLRNCRFVNCVVGPTIGSNLYPISDVLVEDCEFIENRSDTNWNVDGLLIDEPRDPETGTYSKDHRVTIRNCVAIGHGDAGFDIKPVATIENCVARDNSNVGFKLWGVGTKLVNCLAEGNDDAGASMANNGQVASQCTFRDNGTYAVRAQGLEGQRFNRCVIIGRIHNANFDNPAFVMDNSLFWVPGDDPGRWAVTGKRTSYAKLVYTWAEVMAGQCPAIQSNVWLEPPGQRPLPADWGYAANRPMPEPGGPQEPPAGGGATVTLSPAEIEALRALQRVLQRIEGGQ